MLTDRYTPFTLSYELPAEDFQPLTSVYEFYKGFIQPVSGGETFRDGKAGETVTHRLYTAIATPAKYGQTVTQNDQSYKILYSIQPAGISAVEHHKEVTLEAFE